MSYILTIKSFRRYEARDSHRVSGVHSSSSKYSTFDAFASPESLEASPSKSHRTPTPATPPNTIYSTPRKSQHYGRSSVLSKMVFSHSKQSWQNWKRNTLQFDMRERRLNRNCRTNASTRINPLAKKKSEGITNLWCHLFAIVFQMKPRAFEVLLPLVVLVGTRVREVKGIMIWGHLSRFSQNEWTNSKVTVSH